jgi:hypothetical protein
MFAYCTIFLLLVSVYAAAGGGIGLMNELFVNRSYKDLRRSIDNLPRLDEQIKAYNCLIDLDMYKGDLASALSNSEDMLRLLDLQANTIRAERDYSPVRRCLRVAFDQTAAVYAVCLFAFILIT